jgi:hypothetical protein
MVVEQVPPPISEQPRWLRRSLDAILAWGIWPERWRPWLAKRADELVAAYERVSGQGTPPPAMQTPEEVALSLLDKEAAPTPVDEPAAPAAPPVAAPAQAPPAGTPAPTRTEVADVFLHDMRDAMQSQSEELERELDDLRAERRTVFRMLVLAASIALLFLLIGAGLVVAGVIAVGVLSALVALVPGAGTLVLRRMENRIDREKDEADALRERKVQLLQAIQVTLMIEDPDERDRAVAELAGELRKRALEARPAPRSRRAS